ncbi:MAG: hypothetical protein WB441_13580 [Nocardioidaceae bacterium]
MAHQRLPYDDTAIATGMTLDARAVEAALRLPSRRSAAAQAARAAVRPAPSLRFEDYPRELAKPSIRVSEAAARLAAVYDRD